MPPFIPPEARDALARRDLQAAVDASKEALALARAGLQEHRGRLERLSVTDPAVAAAAGVDDTTGKIDVARTSIDALLSEIERFPPPPHDTTSPEARAILDTLVVMYDRIDELFRRLESSADQLAPYQAN